MTYQFAINCQFDGKVLSDIYTKYFGPTKLDGRFVEVGASNGQDYSNTCWLADVGWYGLYIEPVVELANKCKKRHPYPNVRVINAAAGSRDGETILYMIDSWGTATSNVMAAVQINGHVNPIKSPVYKLDSLLSILEWPRGFDLLVIDVDFGEIDVLKGFRISHWYPKMVIIELHEESKHPLSEEVRQFAAPYFANAGYEKIYADHINTIFVREP